MAPAPDYWMLYPAAEMISIYDVVDVKERNVTGHSFKRILGRLVEGHLFQNVILLVIIINAITIGVQTNEYMTKNFGSQFEIADNVFLAIFTVEILLKWAHNFKARVHLSPLRRVRHGGSGCIHM